MKITSVSYTKLQTLHGYNNERVGATAEVEEGENPDMVLNLLKDWVNGHLDGRMITVETRDNIQELVYRKESLERELEILNQRWEKAKEFLVLHGLDASVDDGVPF